PAPYSMSLHDALPISIWARAPLDRGEPRQGRGDGQGAAGMGNDRFRSDRRHHERATAASAQADLAVVATAADAAAGRHARAGARDRKSTRLNSSHVKI